MSKIIILSYFKINLIKLGKNSREECYQHFKKMLNLELLCFNPPKILDE